MFFFAAIIGMIVAVLILEGSRRLMMRSHLLYGPVFIPSKDEDIERMIALAELCANEKVADLGSGDGRLVIAVAQRHHTIDGFENSPSLVARSRKKIRQLYLEKKAHIFFQDFWRVDFSKYDVLMMYTSASTMEKLESTIRGGLPIGGRVISNTFPFPHWRPTKKVGQIYVYRQEKKIPSKDSNLK